MVIFAHRGYMYVIYCEQMSWHDIDTPRDTTFTQGVTFKTLDLLIALDLVIASFYWKST